MRRVLPFIVLVGLLPLLGYGINVKRILITDGGKWELENKSLAITCTFFDNETFSRYNPKISDSGIHLYGENNKELTLDIENKEQLVMEDAEYKDGKLRGETEGVEGILIKK